MIHPKGPVFWHTAAILLVTMAASFSSAALAEPITKYQFRVFIEPVVGGSSYARLQDIDAPLTFTIVTSSVKGPTLTHVDAAFSTMSPVFDIEGARQWAIYSGKLTNAQVRKKKPFARIEIPPAAETVLLHMVPQRKNAYSCGAYDISGVRFSSGLGQVANGTEWEVAANVGGVQSIIVPGSVMDLDLSTVERFQLPMQFLIKNGEDWEWVYNSRKATDPKGQVLVLLYQKPGRGQFSMRYLQLDKF